MKLQNLIREDTKRRVISFALKYLIVFLLLSLVLPILSVLIGDHPDIEEVVSATTFIFSLFLPITAVHFLVEDQGTKIYNYFFKSSQGRIFYLVSLIATTLILGVIATLLFGSVCIGYGMVFQVNGEISEILPVAISYLLIPTFYLAVALFLFLYFGLEGVTLTMINLLLLFIFPIVTSLVAPQLGLVILFRTPFYLLSFIAVDGITWSDFSISLVLTVLLYILCFFKIKRNDF